MTAADEGLRFGLKSIDLAKEDGKLKEVGKRYIVGFKDSAKGTAAVQGQGGFVARAMPNIQAIAAYLPEKAVAALSKNPNIEYLEEDGLRFPLSQSTPYGIPLTQASSVSEVSGPVTVCIIDSGYHQNHEDLAANEAVTFASVSSGETAFVDLCGHGTHVAGTIAAVGNEIGVLGVNPGAKLKMHIVKVFSGTGCGWSYTSDLIGALNECRSNAASHLVVNMSLGGASKSRAEQRAFDKAYAEGVLSIAAAGNDGTSRLSYPASYDSVVSVAAIDEQKRVADFSQKNAQVEISAPGVAVLSTVPWLAETYIKVNDLIYQGNGVEFAASSPGVSGILANGGLCKEVGSWQEKVVLCERGDVSFNEKVQNAQKGGAVAVVIYNNTEGTLLATLGSGNSSTIPAIGITKADGITLVGLVPNAVPGLVKSNLTQGASGYEAWNGTSMATPHVAGIAALIWNKMQHISNANLRSALTKTAEDLGASGRDNATGFGLIQAAAAYNSLQQCIITETPEKSCSDGIDNDCDGHVDAADSDCASGGPGGSTCELGIKGSACVNNGDCCSGNCKGKAGSKTCS